MTAMKLTPNAAMRARDVSRPHAEHLAEAEAAEVRGNTERESTGREGTGRPAGREGTGRPAGREGTEWAPTGRAETGRAETGRPATDRAETGSRETRGATPRVSGDDRAGRPGFPRRRRGPRDGGRRGRSSR
jgi:hypothetical protein